jgi:hypothetical protein
MEENSLEHKILKTNWEKYLEPQYFNSKEMFYSPDRLIKTLISLNKATDINATLDFQQDCLNALGNNHRGTYYPATLEAIDIIIEIEKFSSNKICRDCAKTILNDLYYFQLEIGGGEKQLSDEIEKSIREKLKPYSDENL